MIQALTLTFCDAPTSQFDRKVHALAVLVDGVDVCWTARIEQLPDRHSRQRASAPKLLNTTRPRVETSTERVEKNH